MTAPTTAFAGVPSPTPGLSGTATGTGGTSLRGF